MNTNRNTSSLDSQWRSFFYGENHQLLSNILVSIFNDFLKVALQHKIVLDTPENQQILKRIDQNDLSHSTKLADTYFETKFFNRAGFKIKCTLNSGLKKFQKESLLLLSINEVDKLKLDIHKCGQFETISKILLQARNINAHWHVPIEDSGNAALVSGAILRLIELFELESFDIDKIEKLRTICTKLISSIGIYESNEIEFVSNTLKETENKNEKYNVFSKEEILLEELKDERVPLEENSSDEEEINLPDINFQPKNTIEQKRQSLMKLSYELLVDERLTKYKIKRSNCLLSRHCIKDFLGIKNADKDKINNCLTVSFMRKENKASLDLQIEYYVAKILKIIGD